MNKKMTTKEIKDLKAKHRLELVMQEAGERFEADANNPDILRGAAGLVVNTRMQTYEITRLGENVESGDVIEWLKGRYSWSFAMALKYLQSRAPDPIQTQQVKAEKKSKPSRKDLNDYNEPPLDKWQEEALELAGEKIRKYFTWDSYSLIMYLDEVRIEPVYMPIEKYCIRCEEPINWKIEKIRQMDTDHGNTIFRHVHIGQIPVKAYAIKKRINVSYFGLEGSKDLIDFYKEAEINKEMQEKITRLIANSIDGLIEETGALFVDDEDGVVCEKCAWKEYDFQIALSLCRKSARAREKAAEEERKQFERERAEQEESESEGEYEP